MDNTQIIVADVIGVIIVLVVAVGGLLLLRSFLRRLQSGQGPMGSVLHESRELARERLQVERELLAALKETNELLRQTAAKRQSDA